MQGGHGFGGGRMWVEDDTGDQPSNLQSIRHSQAGWLPRTAFNIRFTLVAPMAATEPMTVFRVTL